MLSKLYAAAFAVALLTQGCGGYVKDETAEIGRRPQFFSTSYLFRAGDANVMTMVDRKGKTVQQFTLEPFGHVQTQPLPFDDEEQGVLASGNGDYFVVVADSNYAIQKRDGSVVENPVGLAGKITSAAYDPIHHYLLVADEFKSMAVMLLSPNGDVVGSWTAGSLFPGDKLVVSGTMLDDGRLVLAVGEATLAVVDLPATVAAQAWQHQSFDVPDAKAMTWIASIPDQTDLVMVKDQNRFLLVNVATGAILDSEDMTLQQVLGNYRDYTPHVIYRSADIDDGVEARVLYPGTDGKFVRKAIAYNGNQITTTWLDPSSDTLTVAFDPSSPYSPSYEDKFYFEAQDIYRVRLTDNFVDITKIEEESAMALTPNYIVLLYRSSLGKVKRLTYGKTPDEQLLEGYNLDLFRKRYQ
jgi:hypothetical protein